MGDGDGLLLLPPEPQAASMSANADPAITAINRRFISSPFAERRIQKLILFYFE